MEELVLDGNAIAGLLGEVFTMEMTSSVVTCGNCGAVMPIGRVHVYMHAPGRVGRCPLCGRMLFRIARGSDRAWLDLRGASCIEVAMPGGQSNPGRVERRMP